VRRHRPDGVRTGGPDAPGFHSFFLNIFQKNLLNINLQSFTD
jgi:hypothetical protein